MKRSELWRHEIRFVADVAESCNCRDRELGCVVETRVIESALALHLEVGDEAVPVRHGTPARPGVQVDAGEAERRRYQGRGRLAVGPERLAVHEELRVELAGSPAAQHFAHGGRIDRRIDETEQVDEGLNAGGESDDRSDVEIPRSPPILAMPDARREGIVDSRVAERAGYADGLQASAVRVEESADTDD